MENVKINQLIELLEELQQKEYWNETNLLNNEIVENKEELDFELDIYTNIELLLDFIIKNYKMQDINAWKINLPITQ